MKTERTHYKVDIFGEQYVLVSDDPADRVMHAISLVDSLMREIATKGAVTLGIDTKKMATSCCITDSKSIG